MEEPPQERRASFMEKLAASAARMGSMSHQISPNLRAITFNQPSANHFSDNRVITSQYTLINFIPKNIYKQFQRIANVYFLLIMFLQMWEDVSITGGSPSIAMPLGTVICASALKDALEDRSRHQADKDENNMLVNVYNPSTKQYTTKEWHNVAVGDVIRLKNRERIPADMVLLNSSDANNLTYVMTAGLDGETNLKLRQVVNKLPVDLMEGTGTIRCDMPNKSIETFNGTISWNGQDGNEIVLPLGPKNVILRGCQIRNTDWITGAVIYTGHETKIQMNAAEPTFKTSSYMDRASRQMKYVFLLQCLLCLSAATYSALTLDVISKHEYLGEKLISLGEELALRFFNYIIIFTNFIPISLLVTIDMVKFFQAIWIRWDKEMYYPKLGKSAQVRCSELNEELGVINHVFSDKTGTLTANIMEFRKCSIAGVSYGLGTTEVGIGVLKRNGQPIPDDIQMDENVPNVNFVDPKLLEDMHGDGEQGTRIHSFMLSLALNHGVMPECIEGGAENEVLYSASSPDEGALVAAAKYFGFYFWKREPEQLTCNVLGEDLTFKVLRIFDFTSTRKRSSVIVETESGMLVLYTKGADSVICERLSNDHEKGMVDRTKEHIDQYAADGLRTLCIAQKTIPQEQYNEWSKKYDAAERQLEGRDEALHALQDELETDLTIVGATAIEDNLQDGVSDTIASLRAAGVKVWMLTGDKVDTAINIGFSCALWTMDMKLIRVVAGEGEMECNPTTHTPYRDSLDKRLTATLNEAHNLIKTNGGSQELCLVVDTGALAGMLEYNEIHRFLQLADMCKSVICARVSPSQKGQIVSAVRKKEPGVRTLSIGDGANDVPMIQQAHVGIGIYGEEGLQAVNAADFAIGQFRYLKRLMLLHGRWSARRSGVLICYMFYKNCLLVLPQFIFAFLCGASGQNFYVEYPLYQGHNLLFTAFPIISFAVLDKDVDELMSLGVPKLYKDGNLRTGHFLNTRVFWGWMAEAILQAACMTLIVVYAGSATQSGGIASANGQTLDIWYLGTCIHLINVIVATLRLCLETKTWCWLTWACIVFSFGSWFLSVGLFSEVYDLSYKFNSMGNIGLWSMMYNMSFWAILVLAIGGSILPSYIREAIRALYSPRTADHCMVLQNRKQHNLAILPPKDEHVGATAV